MLCCRPNIDLDLQVNQAFCRVGGGKGGDRGKGGKGGHDRRSPERYDPTVFLPLFYY